ncbi:hypothetical protein G210_4365 [Candida maltosa Xu316]|uniref:Uncharacterized protein n=1 Tax=Candida maltosa (strain Xu316) TaxID=1245528 RepID=M3JT37_CANMX|nr:hypothetical protein G210_4365 [Candida maltosa Xu316]
MSTFKRLLPAPPPTINAWSINQLINITDKDGSHLHKLHSSNSDDNDSISSGDIEILSGPLKSISSPQSPISSSIKDSVTVPFSAPVTNTKSIDDNDPIVVMAEGNDDEEYDEDGDVLVSVGKNIKIKKPKFPKSNKIKGGTGHYKYRITDTTKDSPPFIINSGSHSPIQQDYSMPSPVESISGGPSSSSPHMLVYPQFGIPIYHVSMVNDQSPPLQTSPVFTASPMSPKSGKWMGVSKSISY